MLNPDILSAPVQDYIFEHLKDDPAAISLSKSPFTGVRPAELAEQVRSRRKSEKKLPTWFNQRGVYFPPPLSIEQSSSERTAAYKSGLVQGGTLCDITAGFGVDSYYFSRSARHVVAYEQDAGLSAISKHNAGILDLANVEFRHGDGLEFVLQTEEQFDTVYADPARRSAAGKVFKLADCQPNLVPHLDRILKKCNQLIIKTSPLLDLQAGIRELGAVRSIHIVSIKNEVKELIWILEEGHVNAPEIICSTLNGTEKSFSFTFGTHAEQVNDPTPQNPDYLYEPDAALLKSGAFDLIGQRYGLVKFDRDSHLYYSEHLKRDFPGRIFRMEQELQARDLKKLSGMSASVIARNYPDQAERIVKKYNIQPSENDFLLFSKINGKLVILKTAILRHY